MTNEKRSDMVLVKMELREKWKRNWGENWKRKWIGLRVKIEVEFKMKFKSDNLCKTQEWDSRINSNTKWNTKENKIWDINLNTETE